MSRPENMTPDEAEIWQRMELHGEELVRDMGAALMQADKLPEWMQEAAVNMLCDKLADARALAASWMNDHSKAEREEAAKEFGEMMQDRLLAMVRGKGKRYMVSSEKEMSFMTELMRRQGEVQP